MKKREKNKYKKYYLLTKVLFILDIMAILCLFVVYGPIAKFRNFWITSSMTTMTHQYLAYIFYDKDTIENVLANNYVIESTKDTDTSLIDIIDNTKYVDEYDKEILQREKNALYKLITINENGYNGYLVAIYDSSKIKLVTTKYLGGKGEYLIDMAKETNAIVAINGGGFIDEGGEGNGGTVAGILIKDGKILNSVKYNMSGGLIGFTKDNILFLGKVSADEAIKKGIRDAVEFGPFLIVNGEPSFISGNGGYGVHPRTAIGQRKDGIVLFLVINGRSVTSLGASVTDLTKIMLKYKAYNASNLDGGTSSALVINNRLINNPINWYDEEKTRPIPNGFIVVQ